MPQTCRLFLEALRRPQDLKQAPRLSFCALQHLRNQVPFFSLSLTKKRLENVALFSRSAVLRVWLPFLRFPLPESLGAFFSSQHSWASPYRAFFLSDGCTILSSRTFRSCAFLQNPLDLVTALQRVTHLKSLSPDCFPKYSLGSGSDALLGIRASWAFSPLGQCHNYLCCGMPLAFLDDKNLTASILTNLRGF